MSVRNIQDYPSPPWDHETQFRQNFLLVRNSIHVTIRKHKYWLCEKKKLYGLSPRANYTDRETTACRWSVCQLLRIEGATWCYICIHKYIWKEMRGGGDLKLRNEDKQKVNKPDVLNLWSTYPWQPVLAEGLWCAVSCLLYCPAGSWLWQPHRSCLGGERRLWSGCSYLSHHPRCTVATERRATVSAVSQITCAGVT
jgi:hypothetical protein